MSLGFDDVAFLETNIKPIIQDPGISKRLVFSLVTRVTNANGSQTKTEIQSETIGITVSNPKLSTLELQQVFPEGEISNEVIKLFFIESDLSFSIKNGYKLLVYKSTVLLGEYRIKYVSRNMVLSDFVVAFAVSGR